jgi:glycerol-3-phosphate cytidylyltransferase
LGVEYEGRHFTGRDECHQRDIEIIFNRRDHSFSSSSLRKRVVTAETEKILREKAAPVGSDDSPLVSPR